MILKIACTVELFIELFLYDLEYYGLTCGTTVDDNAQITTELNSIIGTLYNHLRSLLLKVLLVPDDVAPEVSQKLTYDFI